MKNKNIFMDYQSTTPLDPRVMEAMMPYFMDKFGNCHSRDHCFGWEADEAVEDSRKKVASIIDADPREIIFTSGATESNNLALKGVSDFYRKDYNHIIISAIEHKCIINTGRYLSSRGFNVSYLPVQKSGVIDLDVLCEMITPKTILVSIMAINNEIGTIQPLAKIGALCREKGVFFHTDAAQAFGKIPIDVNQMNIDLLSISAHKIYGPKGIGALYIRRNPKVRITPIIHGGMQERGMRSGTVPVPLAVGFGEAALLSSMEMLPELKKLKVFFNKFYDQLVLKTPYVHLNGSMDMRFPGNINLSFACVEGESMMGAISNIAVSSGSACTSSSLESSHVLKAIDTEPSLAHTAIRFGMGRFTTSDEVDYVINSVKNVLPVLRDMSPLWEELQEQNNNLQLI
ncbi:cysteine desulfurase IscS [Candidatus Xenohaliotis californiensis]|uniref:Cysteine desulfurase IscS n=2 Tax=Candidatus Xenohaliotis californiensis TaxID=84677 RepID=A0ABM9N8U6_9RICK|nr:cysteine desulfurase IscS [Candidatus Xenohaliotis californiensis]